MKLFVILVWFFAAASSFAQDITYYSKYDQILKSKDFSYYYVEKNSDSKKGDKGFYTETSAVYFTEIYDTENGTSNRMYYYPNGILKASGRYSGNLSGEVKSYYQNGQLQGEYFFPEGVSLRDWQGIKIVNYNDSLGNSLVRNGEGFCRCNFLPFSINGYYETGSVKNGKREGEWVGSYESGLSYRDKFEQGVLVEGNSTYKGQTFWYKELESQPAYAAGNQALYDHIASNISYPKSARKSGLQGTVNVSFLIDENGKPGSFKVVKGISDECDAEALRVISTMGSWIPGKQRGVPVRVRLTLPVNFRFK